MTELTSWIIYVALMVLGAVMAMVLPYLLNAWVDPKTRADWKYVVVLLIGIIFTVFLAAPGKVDALDVDAFKAAVLAGFGLQAAVNKTISTLVKKYGGT